MSEKVRTAFRGCSTHYCNYCYLWGTPINIREKQCGNCLEFSLVNLEEFIKTFAAQKVKEATEPLVEALEKVNRGEHIIEKSNIASVNAALSLIEVEKIVRDALIAHKAKMGREG